MDEKPAIDGGKPVREAFLPYYKVHMGDEEIEEVVKVLRSGWLTMGPKVKEFEDRFAEFIGTTHAVAVNSCTAGLHLSLVAHGIGPGDEVIVPTYTFASTASTVVWTGAKPVLVDIENEGFNISPEAVEEAITNNTKAIIPVHFGGMPCDMDELQQIADKHNLVIIEDAAHTIGVKYRDREVGTLGSASSFSFYATKNLTTGEGGMVTTNDTKIAERIRSLRLHGMTKDAWKRYDNQGSWYYGIDFPGFKCNMTDVQAALGLVQLSKLHNMNRQRMEKAILFSERLGELEGIIIPKEREDRGHCWHLYPIRVREDALRICRDRFIEALHAENVGTSVHFIPLHRHNYYNNAYNLKKEDFPNAECVFAEEISLPLYPNLTKNDICSVIDAVEKVYKYYKK